MNYNCSLKVSFYNFHKYIRETFPWKIFVGLFF